MTNFLESNKKSKSVNLRGERPYYAGIPYEALKRIALAANEGFIKYDKFNVFEQTYKTLSPEDFILMFNHVIDHVYKALDEVQNGSIHNGKEDHLGHAAMNLCMIMWATEKMKLPNKTVNLIEPQNEQMDAEVQKKDAEVQPEERISENISSNAKKILNSLFLVKKD